ncbi:MAG: hypothetical protein PVF82_21010 [Gammaproteobacteria bacterium]|jgi:hypothetical protein
MKPIYMSANYEQVDIIKALLTENGIDTKLQAKEDANNPLAPKGIIWFELWLMHQVDEDDAETIIEKHEFSQLRNSLKVTWEALHAPKPAEAKDSEKPITLHSTVSKEKREALMRATYESWLPVNNQKVFHRLASMLGFSEEEISGNEFNKIRRPWNPDRLKSQVQALQQICKGKSSLKALSNP